MTDTREQIALKFPAGTRERIEALRLERETTTAVILRALAALERPTDARLDTSSQRLDSDLCERLDRIETRLDRIEQTSRQPSIPASAPIPPKAPPTAGSGSHTRYSDEAKRYALELLDAGRTHRQIADALAERFGYQPNTKNLPRHFARWRDELRAGSG